MQSKKGESLGPCVPMENAAACTMNHFCKCGWSGPDDKMIRECYIHSVFTDGVMLADFTYKCPDCNSEITHAHNVELQPVDTFHCDACGHKGLQDDLIIDVDSAVDANEDGSYRTIQTKFCPKCKNKVDE